MRKMILLLVSCVFVFACSSGGGGDGPGGGGSRIIPADGTYEAISIIASVSGATVDVYDTLHYRYNVMVNPLTNEICTKEQYYAGGIKEFDYECSINVVFQEGDGVTYSGDADRLTLTIIDVSDDSKLVATFVRKSTSTALLDNSLIYEWSTIGATYIPQLVEETQLKMLGQLFYR